MNIFGGTEPPAWLNPIAGENRRLAGQFGHEAGLNLAALIRTVAPGDEPKIGFSQAYQEARLNEADPMWRLKAEQAKAGILGTVAQAQGAYALLRERNAETEAWAQDAPEAAKFFAATPEQRATMPTPAFKSQKAISMLERIRESDSTYEWRKDMNQSRLEQQKQNSQRLKYEQEWNNTFFKAPEDVKAIIEGLPNKGRDEQGFLTAEAKSRLGQYQVGIAEQAIKAGSLSPTAVKDGKVTYGVPKGGSASDPWVLKTTPSGVQYLESPGKTPKILSNPRQSEESKLAFKEWEAARKELGDFESGKTKTGDAKQDGVREEILRERLDQAWADLRYLFRPQPGATAPAAPAAPATAAAAAPAPSPAPEPAVQARLPMLDYAGPTTNTTFRDATGKRFRYIGNSANPKTDTDPAHWVEM